MRFGLFRVGLLLAGLSLLALPALAGGADREIERELSFSLEAEGFKALVFVTNNDGDVEATLLVNRGSQIAYYGTPATVTAERVTARFGQLGELDYRFAPKQRGKVECAGAEDGEVVFDGTFEFSGENGYVHIEADHAEGSLHVYPEPRNCQERRLARSGVPYHPSYSDAGATLQATARSRADGTVREVTAFDDGGRRRHRVGILAMLGERREGMTIARGLQMPARSSAFDWDLAKGKATLRPPAPFTGSATFTRRGKKSHGSWKGSLAMPVLGGEPVALTGGDFRAFIHKGVPQDE